MFPVGSFTAGSCLCLMNVNDVLWDRGSVSGCGSEPRRYRRAWLRLNLVSTPKRQCAGTVGVERS